MSFTHKAQNLFFRYHFNKKSPLPNLNSKYEKRLASNWDSAKFKQITL